MRPINTLVTGGVALPRLLTEHPHPLFHCRSEAVDNKVDESDRRSASQGQYRDGTNWQRGAVLPRTAESASAAGSERRNAAERAPATQLRVARSRVVRDPSRHGHVYDSNTRYYARRLQHLASKGQEDEHVQHLAIHG